MWTEVRRDKTENPAPEKPETANVKTGESATGKHKDACSPDNTQEPKTGERGATEHETEEPPTKEPEATQDKTKERSSESREAQKSDPMNRLVKRPRGALYSEAGSHRG